MAKRVLLGKPTGEEPGIYVSKPGTDVIDGSGNLTSGINLMFDSRLGLGALNLKYHGQGILGVPTLNETTDTNLDTSDKVATITHSLGFVPFYIVQWCFSTDISGGVATKMYTADVDWNTEATRNFAIFGTQYWQYQYSRGGVVTSANTTTLTITNNFIGQLNYGTVAGFRDSGQDDSVAGKSIYYAFLIFDVIGG